jgi:riboflavin biosynthesis pyrimidine reductase
METDRVTVLRDDSAKFVRNLKKKKKGKEICVMGGGEFARSLFEAGVIDEIGFNIHPVLLGSGIPQDVAADRPRVDRIEGLKERVRLCFVSNKELTWENADRQHTNRS